ncbi:hypothetical protein PYCC9005_002014 [Savitreella phatthalungensis]
MLRSALCQTSLTGSARSFSTSSPTCARSLVAIRRKKRAIARQQELAKERDPERFDPILGVPTDFTKSLLTAAGVWEAARQTAASSAAAATHEPGNGDADRIRSIADDNLHFSSDEVREIQAAVKQAYTDRLANARNNPVAQPTTPTPPGTSQTPTSTPQSSSAAANRQEVALAREMNAMQASEARKSAGGSRVVSLLNASGSTLQTYNRGLAISAFARAEGDTGSSEVQAAVLTARIHGLAHHFESQGSATPTISRKDNQTYRSFRKLVHQRQKILKYLRSHHPDRYFDCIKRLGLDDAAITREITM